MNKFIFLIIISIFTIGGVSCKKSGSSNIKPKDSTKTTPTYYINYKVNGTAVTDTTIVATRDAGSNPRTMTITGTTKTGAAVNFKFYTEETIAGFSPGLTMECTEFSYPTDYTEYTNASGTVYNTKNDTDAGIYFGILAISYTQGGIMNGIFSGSITNAAGGIDQITEGTYNVKFSN